VPHGYFTRHADPPQQNLSLVICRCSNAVFQPQTISHLWRQDQRRAHEILNLVLLLFLSSWQMITKYIFKISSQWDHWSACRTLLSRIHLDKLLSSFRRRRTEMRSMRGSCGGTGYMATLWGWTFRYYPYRGIAVSRVAIKCLS
jgi:hypothetical protein